MYGKVSLLRQFIFGIIVLIIILGIVEAASNVWWSNIQDCALEESEIYEHLSQEEKRQLCQDLYNIKNSEIKNLNLIYSNLDGANLDGAVLTDVDLGGTTLTCINHPICN